MRIAYTSPASAACRPTAASAALPPAHALARPQQRALSRRQNLRCSRWRQCAEPEGSSEQAASSSSPAADVQPETVFYEGSGSNAELVISLLLGATLLFLPLTIASIGRRLWVSYKFTNKRLVVATNSPVLKREVQVEYSKIKEIRSAPRAFGLWGDVVFFLKDGSRLPLAGLERYQEIVDHVQGKLD